MKEYIARRVMAIADYMIETRCTVRNAAVNFGVSKSTVHTEGVILKLFIRKWRKCAPCGDFIKSEIFRAYLYKNQKS